MPRLVWLVLFVAACRPSELVTPGTASLPAPGADAGKAQDGGVATDAGVGPDGGADAGALPRRPVLFLAPWLTTSDFTTTSAFAAGISNDGLVVGEVTGLLSDGGGQSRSFIFEPSKPDLRFFDGGFYGVTAISRTVVCGHVFTGSTPTAAVYVLDGGAVVPLFSRAPDAGPFATLPYSWCVAVNDRGDALAEKTSSAGADAVLFPTDQPARLLASSMDGGTRVYPRGLSEDGAVVGFISCKLSPTSTSSSECPVFVRDGVTEQLEAYHRTALAFDVASSGLIVGHGTGARGDQAVVRWRSHLDAQPAFLSTPAPFDLVTTQVFVNARGTIAASVVSLSAQLHDVLLWRDGGFELLSDLLPPDEDGCLTQNATKLNEADQLAVNVQCADGGWRAGRVDL